MTTSTDRSSVIVLAFRALWHLLSVVAVSVWSFLAWQLPLPGLPVGIAVTLFAVVLWALFLSPKPVLAVDSFVRSLIELLLVASAVAAALTLGIPWWIAAIFGLGGAVLGFLAATVVKPGASTAS